MHLSIPRGATLALLLLVVLAAPAGARAAEVRPASASGPLGDELLSDERTLTRWAHADFRTPVRVAPRKAARAFTRLRHLTEDGFPEVYLVLRSKVGRDGRVWLHVRVPMRPNGRRGWVPRGALADLQVVRTRFEIDRAGRRARLFDRDRVIWRSRVGIGAPGTPTPRGRFWVRELIRVRPTGGLYGPWAFGTSAYSILSDWPGGGVVGIHGTNQPGLIPGRPSHGCVRVPNKRIRKLAKLMPIGTPVRIL